MTGFAAKLAAVEEAVRELRTTEDAVEDARARFRAALREAHEAGASYAQLGRLAGLTRQRVARIVAGD